MIEWLKSVLSKEPVPPVQAVAAPPCAPTQAAETPEVAAAVIVVDHREAPSGLADAIREAAPGVRVEVATLDVGDVIVHGSVAIERKRCDDFAASIRDGRLLGQASRMAQTYRRRVLILEGEFDRDAIGGMAPDAIRGAIISLQMDWGMALIRTRSVRETAAYIAQIEERVARKSARGGTAAPPPRGGPIAAPTGASAVETFAATIEGVGPTRARALAKAFPSVAVLMAASERELSQVEGIGPTTAASIHQRLHEREGAPGSG